ncbi:hypothetical protein C8J57DRAFT_1243302 [Mycena rebaudengoi]|nr:hypothetical protein C8J57DRAFT_1243302 [Mycena rebaudengoi]
MARTTTARTSHASRNPTQSLIPCRQRPSNRKGESAAVKASRALASAERKERQALLDADIDAYYADQGQFIQQMALKHKKPVKYMLSLISHQANYKKARKPSLLNAIIHDMSVKANDDGEATKLADLRAELDERCTEYDDGYDGYVKALEETEKLRLVAQLLDHRDTKKRGARATNKAAAMDALAAADRISDELANLYDRTGVQGFYVLSRGNADDAALPRVGESAGSLGFMQQVLDVAPLDLLRKFEQWCCTQDAGGRAANTVSQIRKEIVALILGGLRKATNNKQTVMSYQHYDSDVRAAHKVEIVGWPMGEIPFRTIGKISEMGQLRKLREMLQSGEIKWVNMTKSQLTELNANLAARRTANGGSLKTRKPRADKGKSRKGKAATKPVADDDSDGSASSSDEEDDDDDGDDGDEDDEDDRCAFVTPCLVPTTTTTTSTSAGAASLNVAAASTTATAAAPTASTAAAAEAPPTSKKRKAQDDSSAPAKKARKERSDKGVRRAGAGTPVFDVAAKKPRKARKDKGAKRSAPVAAA